MDIPRLTQRYALLVLDFGTRDSLQAPKFTTTAFDECSWGGVTCANGTNLVTRIVWSDQGLGGTIPQDIGLLKNLTHLDLAENALGGQIPDGLYDLVQLEYLYLHSNRLTGSISEKIANLFNLINLFLGENQLSGKFPKELGSPELGGGKIRPLRM
jgi:Leucine-rich repeat (LRR) protein